MSLPRKVLEKYITPGCTFIETGSRCGLSLIRAAECGASKLLGCEVDLLYAHVCAAVLHGEVPYAPGMVYPVESIKFLRQIGSREGDTDVVFLDAHTETASPVIQELNEIHSWSKRPQAILIDDLRCMSGWKVEADTLSKLLVNMGYKVSYEDGVEPRDIMVGVMP